MSSRSKRGWRSPHRHQRGTICPIQHNSRFKAKRSPEAARQMAIIRERGPRSPGNLLHEWKKFMATPYVAGVDTVTLVDDGK